MQTPIKPSVFIEEFVKAYLVCALWSSTDNADDTGGEPLDRNYDVSDIDPKSYDKMREDCLKFILMAFSLMEDLDPSQCGHDFWLTRNGHGTGFWDRDLGETGEKLTKISQRFGECNLEVGDDGSIHVL